MKTKVKILSPGPGCWKSKKIIRSMENFMVENNIEADFEVVTKLKDFLKYRTWILPTVIINNKVVARGYRPTNEVILKNLNNER